MWALFLCNWNMLKCRAPDQLTHAPCWSLYQPTAIKKHPLSRSIRSVFCTTWFTPWYRLFVSINQVLCFIKLWHCGRLMLPWIWILYKMSFRMTPFSFFSCVCPLDNLFKPKDRVISGKEMQLHSKRLVHTHAETNILHGIRMISTLPWKSICPLPEFFCFVIRNCFTSSNKI